MSAITPLKVTFWIDPFGIIYDPFVPPTLDGIIDWALSPMVRQSEIAPTRDGEPEEIRLPLGTWHIGDYWGWCASALHPESDDGEIEESIVHFRKRFRESFLYLTVGTINTKTGPTRSWDIPYNKQMPVRMVGYCVGNRKRINDLLQRNVRYLATKRRRGMGRIEEIAVEIIDNDYSLVRDGLAMRYLPDKNGLREVRLRPPYWNNNGRVACCEIGDKYGYTIMQP